MCKMVSHIDQVIVASINVTTELYYKQQPNFIFKTDLRELGMPISKREIDNKLIKKYEYI